jgi:hypothetical protein
MQQAASAQKASFLNKIRPMYSRKAS